LGLWGCGFLSKVYKGVCAYRCRGGKKMEKGKNEKIDTWSSEELKKINEQRIQRLREKGKNPYLKLPKGVSEIKVLPEIPTKRTNNFGKEVADFTVEYQNEKYTWSVATNSPLYRKVLERLQNHAYILKVIKSGEGKTTRYDIME